MTDGNPAKPVRDEDAFDVGAVAGWLREHAAAGVRDDLVGTPEVQQFQGGASNLTYLLRWPARDLILRRPPAGVKARGAHDMGREHRIQAALAPVFPLVPAMVAHCEDDALIGSPFYVMDEVEAALDDTNLGRLITIFEELRESSQLIVITHQKRTMEVADALYGVTMRGDGVSTVISQRLGADV